MKSVWHENIEKPSFPSLKGDVKTDILIIGGGLTGLLTAHLMEKAGVDYMLIEADEICSGITKNTTAKITVQHGLIYDKIIRKYGVAAARQYYNANNEALYKYRELCKVLDCKFEEKDAIVYSLNNERKIRDEINAYKTLGVDVSFQKSVPLPFGIVGAVKIKGQGQINPLEFLYKISEKLNIYENTKLVNFMGNLAETNNGTIHFKKAIIATHFPIFNKRGSYFLKMHQHRSYVIALENAQSLEGMYVDEDLKGLSFRSYNNLLLIGGGSHRTGKKGGQWKELTEFAKIHYNNAKEKYRWATQDCMSLDGIPYIGNYSKHTPDLYVATGYNKWGFTSSLAAAQILYDTIMGNKNENAEVFSPSRSIISSELLVNGFEAVTNLLTPTAPRCPHLGCALKYNKAEHSWDCPCHGSRFTKDGELIDNPATDDIKSNPTK